MSKIQSENKQVKYTETEALIVKMLQENTGSHFLDSGGAYGRNWQRNQKIKSFKDLPAVNFKVWKDGQLELTVNIFHYLSAYLELDKVAKNLQRRFDRFESKPENESVGWLALLEQFVDKLKEKANIETHGTTNTYNYDNLLSQVLQYAEFEIDGETYIALQIHNGCDVRGGYTAPKFFRVRDSGYFHLAQYDIDLSCGCTSRTSDDCGYHWYEGRSPDKTELDKLLGTDLAKDEIPHGKLPKYWKVEPAQKDAKNWQYKLTCLACKQDVTPTPSLDF